MYKKAQILGSAAGWNVEPPKVCSVRISVDTFTNNKKLRVRNRHEFREFHPDRH